MYSAGLDYKRWDFSTITSGDFSIQVSIPEAVWTVYNSFDPAERPHGFFKEFLRKEIEKQLRDKEAALEGKEGPVQVAYIGLAFDNGDVIKMLFKRGKMISNGYFAYL